MNRLKDALWPAIGLAAVIWAMRLLYLRLKAEVASTAAVKAELDAGTVWQNLGVIARVIGAKIAAIPPEAFALAAVSTLVAYLALGWYDRLAMIHLGRERNATFSYAAITAFVTYALSHNIGASVLSGGAVRYRAYTAKGMTGGEVAVLVALCTFTFALATAFMMGLALVVAPDLLHPLTKLSPAFDIPDGIVRLIGAGLLAACALYIAGAFAGLRSFEIAGQRISYPGPRIVALQVVFAPLEIAGAAGIIYFALQADPHPGYFLVLGAFLLSFSAGLISQVPGGVGVMEAVFLALMPDVPASSVFAALLVWRLFYLILPLVVSLPIILAFERAQYRQGGPPRG
jgi:uncharacterized membrane protein YbhN (UPF0104 family)